MVKSVDMALKGNPTTRDGEDVYAYSYTSKKSKLKAGTYQAFT